MIIRLFGPWALVEDSVIAVEDKRAHYLVHVMRAHKGSEVALFNGRDGEWLACVTDISRRSCTLIVREQLRPQDVESADVWLLFAPIKRLCLNLLTEKACELGASMLWPLFTQHTAVARVNMGHLRLHIIEATEQCGRLTVPAVRPMTTLDQALAAWPADRRLIVCDESRSGTSVAVSMAALGPGPVAILVGPEGGLAKTELDLLRILPFATRVGLGPRILRTETAALAALACWQALCGDWCVQFRQRAEI